MELRVRPNRLLLVPRISTPMIVRQVGVIGGSGSFGVRRCWITRLATAANALIQVAMIMMVVGSGILISVIKVARLLPPRDSHLTGR